MSKSFLILIKFTLLLLVFMLMGLMMFNKIMLKSKFLTYINNWKSEMLMLTTSMYLISIVMLFLLYNILEFNPFLMYEYWTYYNFSPTSNNYFQIYMFPFIWILIFITMLSIILTLPYSRNEFSMFIVFVLFMYINGILFFSTDSLMMFFLTYENFLFPSFMILYKFAKTRKAIEASFLMFFWTQFGALALFMLIFYMGTITNSYYFSDIYLFKFTNFDLMIMYILIFIGFGVKLPIWPFYGWLPKAHVEASTNFSIFLSGVLVKFAFFGLFKFLSSLNIESLYNFFLPILVIGLIDATMKLFTQTDLKKLIAYMTVVEMHWLTMATFSGYSPLFLSAICMFWNHALLSTNAFLLVDSISSSFKTRNLNELGGLNLITPNLFFFALINLLLFLGFPGSMSFMSELLFFSFLFDYDLLIFFILIMMLYLIVAIFFFSIWVQILFSTNMNYIKTIPVDMTYSELIIYSSLLLLSIFLGLTWHIFLN